MARSTAKADGRNQSVEDWIKSYEEAEMADMSKYNVENESDNDLKASEEQGKTYKLTIKSVGEVTYPPGKFSDVPVTKSTLFFKETEKRLVVRPASNRHLCKEYGDDSAGWIGKTVSAESEAWTSDTGSGWMWTVRALEVQFDDVPEPDPSDIIPF